MILDQLANAKVYVGLAEGLVRALRFLRETDLSRLAEGRHAIEGDDVFALVQDYETRPAAVCRWEAHRRYCDVQFVASGAERIGVAPLERMRIVEAYDEAKDVAFFEGEGDFVTLRSGMFAILWPHDAHMPCTIAGTAAMVRKVVVKVAHQQALPATNPLDQAH